MSERSSETLFAELAEKFIAQHRATKCTVEEFAAQNVAHADIINGEFESIVLMEMFREPIAIDKPIPIQLGNYILEEEIGRGGMGIVYSAHHPTLGNKVAVKLLQLADSNRGFSDRFRNEAKIGADLDHPNIVPVFDFGCTEHYAYCTMRRIQGLNLKHFSQACLRGKNPLAPTPELNWDLIAEIGVQAAEALEYAHSKGVIHRDVKPSNIILDENAKVWVTDFGTAKLLDADTKLTMTGDVVGTVRYMPPEQLLGKYTTRSDVFGLGLTLSELVASACGIDPDEKKNGEFGSVSPDLWNSSGQVPRELARIVQKACDFQPEQRYQSAAELAYVLKRFLAGHRRAERRISGNVNRKPWIRKARIFITTLALLALSLFAISSTSYRSDTTPKPKELTREETITYVLTQNPKLAYVPESRKFFLLCEGKHTWEQAAKLAQDPKVNALLEVPGYLATIRTKQENEAAWELARKFQTSLHIGGSDADSHGYWHWDHKGRRKDLFWQQIYKSLGFKTPGTEFVNFAPDRPNRTPSGQHWLSLRYEDGKWQDVNDKEELGYLVEWSEADVIPETTDPLTFKPVTE